MLIKVNIREAISCVHMLAVEKPVGLRDVKLDINSLIKVVNSSFMQLKCDL